MQQVYYISLYGNFCDDLNVWFWDQALPGWRDWDDEVTLIGIGTIQNANFMLLNFIHGRPIKVLASENDIARNRTVQKGV